MEVPLAHDWEVAYNKQQVVLSAEQLNKENTLLYSFSNIISSINSSNIQNWIS